MAILDGMDKLQWAEKQYEPAKTLWVASEIQIASNGHEYEVRSFTSDKSSDDALAGLKMNIPRNIVPSRRYEVSQYAIVQAV